MTRNNREGRTLRECVIEGIVDEMYEESAKVIFDIGGDDVIRYIDGESLKDLRNVGAVREGQCFNLHAREYELNGQCELETWFAEVEEEPPLGERIDMFPDIDISKFRRTSQYEQ